MATEDESAADAAVDPAAAPVPCSACRGTGQVVSNLGGQRSLVECPWCDGAGTRITEHDAQARRRAEHGDGGSPAWPPDGTGDRPDGEPPGGEAA